MPRLALAIALFTLTVSTVHAADQIELRNGDHLSGTVVKYTGETLVFTTPYAKEIAIAWAEVQTLTTETPYWVKLSSGEYVSARFTPRADGLYLEPEAVEARPVALADVVTIGIPPGARWSADLKAVVNGSQGNSKTFALGAAAEAIRETDGDRLRFGGSIARESKDDDEDTVKNTRGWGNYDYHLGAHWDLGGFLTLEYDHFKNLDLRTVVGAGPGYRFIDTKTMLFKVHAGLAYVNENFNSGESDRDYLTAVAGDELRWTISGSQSVYQLLDVYPSLARGEDVFLHAEAGFRQALWKGIFLELALIDDYDNLPADDRKKNDFKYFFQLGYHL